MAALPGLLDPYAFRRTGTLYQISMAIDGVAKWELFECLILTQRRRVRRGGLLSLLGVLEFGRWGLQGAPSLRDGAMKSEQSHQ